MLCDREGPRSLKLITASRETDAVQDAKEPHTMHNPIGPLAAAVYVANMASAASILEPIPAHESARLEAGV